MNIKEMFKLKNYVFKQDKDFVNLFGIRMNDEFTDKFDDYLGIIVNNQVYLFEGTTDSGFYYVKNKLNPKGTAVLKEGQWIDSWKLGFHKGYEALVQCKPVEVYRDINTDFKIDRNVVDKGIFGINIHKSGDIETIGKYSAGCQVFKNIKDFEFVINLCKIHKIVYGNKFSYTLFNYKDII